MNDLQLGLIGLGAAAVAAVFAYNKWQEHRHRKLAEKVLARDHEDVLLGRDAEREHASAGEAIEELEREPVMADAAPSVSRPARERQEPSIGDDDRRATPVIREEPILHVEEAVPAIEPTAASGTHDSVPPWEAQTEPTEPLISGVQAAGSAAAFGLSRAAGLVRCPYPEPVLRCLPALHGSHHVLEFHPQAQYRHSF